jgi:hypothetical protein
LDSLEKAMTRSQTSPLEETDADLLEPLWLESARRAKENEWLENLLAWRDFHTNMARLHTTLASEHQQKAEDLIRITDDPYLVSRACKEGLEKGVWNERSV